MLLQLSTFLLHHRTLRHLFFLLLFLLALLKKFQDVDKFISFCLSFCKQEENETFLRLSLFVFSTPLFPSLPSFFILSLFEMCHFSRLVVFSFFAKERRNLIFHGMFKTSSVLVFSSSSPFSSPEIPAYSSSSFFLCFLFLFFFLDSFSSITGIDSLLSSVRLFTQSMLSFLLFI